MMHFVLVLGFVSYTFCQIQFPSVDLSSSTPSPPSSPNTGFTKLSSTPTPRSAAIFFPSRQLFGLNEFGYIECQEPTDCPQDVVDTENKKVVNYFCNPLPENEGPGKACTENPEGYYCADPTRPGCDLCLGQENILDTLPDYCGEPVVPIIGGSKPIYLTSSTGQTVSSITGLQGQQGEMRMFSF